MSVLEFPSITVDADGARAYVLAYGGTLEQARLEGILSGMAPDKELRQSLERQQRPDGGFAAVPGGPSDLQATAAMLLVFKDLPPLAGSPMASRAIAFLRRQQQPDGSWGPGDIELTAYLAYIILTLEPEHIDPLARAAAWLQTELAGEAAGEADLPTQARTWAVWHIVLGHTHPDAARLRKLLVGRSFGVVALTVWLTCALEVEAGCRLVIPIVLQLANLAAAQQPDGGWRGGPNATLAALRVLWGFGVI